MFLVFDLDRYSSSLPRAMNFTEITRQYLGISVHSSDRLWTESQSSSKLFTTGGRSKSSLNTNEERKRIVEEWAHCSAIATSRPWIRGLAATRDRSTKFVQVYKFWCYYWGLCLLTELSETCGGLFELLFLSLSFSVLSCSYLYRFYSLSLCFCLFVLLPRFLSASFSSSFSFWLVSTSLAHPLTRSPYPFASHSFHLDHGSLHRPWLVCFPSRRLPFAKRTLNYVADDKYLSRPLRERATTDLCPDRCYFLRLALLASSVDHVTL